MQPQSGWQLSGSGPEAYELYLADPILTQCAPGLIKAAVVGVGDRVLDVACGTGAVTRLAAQTVGTTGRVMGVDVNPGMLAMARQLADQGLATKIEWLQSDAAGLAVPDANFDVALCQQGLQFFPDKLAALREMHRVLAPGGRLACSVLRDIRFNPYQQAIADALGRLVSPEAAAVIHSPFAFGDAETLRALVIAAGFHTVHIRLEMTVIRHHSLEELVVGYLAATPVASAFAALDDKVRSAILNDIRMSLHDYLDDDGLAAPLNFHVVTARRNGNG
ncbi:MAG: class I SAM-dependent methyltransferase [Leptolyngbyaceae cyanobacterium MO_188.B28]|nr:class I SAM-dependent methyltransferase [Leptolyngbyaceae cyanobacterium MO_188.B28]